VELLIVRHAIAEGRDMTKWPDDRGRPLTEDGATRFRKTAKGLGTFTNHPDLVLSSPLTRAWQTAEILAEEAGWPRPEELDALEPERRPEDIRSALQRHANTERVGVVGHEPNLSELASHLLAGKPDAVDIDLKKGAVIALDVGLFPQAGEATLLWAVPPRVLRAL
jgi:phosphohistidine phosphatase